MNMPRKRFVEPIERISEVLFGLIMVLGLTCTFSVAHAGRSEVRHLLLAALGCNLAWAIIDAVFYLMGVFGTQGHGILALRALRNTANPSEARAIIADVLPPLLASAVGPEELDAIGHKLNQLPLVPERPQFRRDDWLAAVGVFLLVFLSTFPVVIPFLLFSGPQRALRASNVVAILMLFLTGFALGRHAGRRPWLIGLTMTIVDSALVGITVAFGG
jgi:hypothetical protein